MTPLPVFGVPVESKVSADKISFIQLCKCLGIPVGTLAIGKPGAINAALQLPLSYRYQMRQSLINSMRGAKNAQIWLPSNLQTRNDKTSLPSSGSIIGI